MGHGPRYGLAIVAVAATPYLAACDQAPAYDGALDQAQVCASYGTPPVRLPDDACREVGPTGRTQGGQWVTATLPPSPQHEVSGWTTDEDGELVETSQLVSDPDDGDFSVVAIGSPLGGGWSRTPPPIASLDRTARGLSPSGGTFTRSGGGTGGVGSPGSRIVARAPVVKSSTGTSGTKAGSGTVSRGGFGGPGAKSSSSGS